MNNSVSANAIAQQHYRNIKPCILHSIGDSTGYKTKSNFRSLPAVCVLPGSQHVVASEFSTANNETGTVRTIDKYGITVNEFKTILNHRGVASFGISHVPNEENNIAVCVGDGVALWDIDGSLIAHFHSPQVTNCSHVTAMKCGLLATTCITETRNKCVTLWDPKSGKIVSQFGSRPEVIDVNPLMATRKVIIRNENIRTPWFVASNKKDNIFIADRNAKSIKVFDITAGNKFIKKITINGPEERDNHPISPHGICVDDSDNLLVVDSYSRSVLLFDPHGQYIKPVLSFSREKHEPWSLAISSSCQLTNNKIKDSTRRLYVGISTPYPLLNVYKLSFCKHYMQF